MPKYLGGKATVIWSSNAQSSQTDPELVRRTVAKLIAERAESKFIVIEIDGRRVEVTLDVDDVTIEEQ